MAAGGRDPTAQPPSPIRQFRALLPPAPAGRVPDIPGPQLSTRETELDQASVNTQRGISELSLRSVCPEWLPASGQVLPPLQAQFPPTEARGESHQLSRDPMEAKQGRPSGDVCQPIH